ncbi:hypothetical protein Tsubulata_044732 [Turnera subulata]|uniref:Uncharacterized protein n=1 Tax=Turnera subulata TaxID=218843 RepID=A0A9Q0FR93_9ROSI|nr:hypothetical protein Tsubulata_044732 [Turnera subulata]
MLLLDRSYTFFVSNNNTLMGSKFGRAIFLKIIPRPTSLGSNLTNLSIGSYLVIGSTKAQLQATDGEAEAGRKRSVAVEDKSDSCAGLIYLIGCLVGACEESAGGALAGGAGGDSAGEAAGAWAEVLVQ